MEIMIQNLLKKYHDKVILDNVNLHFKKGVITGLLGDNGVGKSTLLRIISGIEQDYKGQILYDGIAIKAHSRQAIGMVSQRPYLFKRSVYENIEYPLKIRKVDKAQRREIVADFLKAMNLEEVQHQRADTLSGGQAQKTALARALAAKPTLLLLDETTANIHEEAMIIIEEQLKAYHQLSGCTMIFVTHNLKQAERFCEEKLWLSPPDSKS